jgi:uncharacterized protein (TIGR02678 family)
MSKVLADSPVLVSPASPEVAVDRRRALRILLRRPLLAASGETAEEFLLVRRHSQWLKHWLMKFPEWNLYIESKVARLCKLPPDLLDETRPAMDRTSGTPFSKRRYVLFCLTLAVLERSDRQTTLAQIAHTITELSASDRALQAAGLVFDIGNYDQRRDLIHAVRLLMEVGVLQRLDGDEREFLNRSQCIDVLYDINRAILAAMLNSPQSPSFVEKTVAGAKVPESLTERVSRLIQTPMPGN